MDQEKDEQLFKKFPLLYADNSVWGVSCGNGWYDIIEELSAKLEPLIAALPNDCFCGFETNHPYHEGVCKLCQEYAVKHPFYEWKGEKQPQLVCDKFRSNRPRASQVKEKFGRLRFYMSSETVEMSNLIHKAEGLSYKTCEECGQPGSLDDSQYWLLTLCDKCKAERPKQR